MKTRTLLAMVLLSLSGSAWTQNCGGMPAVNGVCIPPDSPTSPLNSTYGQQPGQPAAPRMIWANRWGAIAIDFTAGKIGTASNLQSKRKAERAALSQCRVNGGGVGCETALTYFNQCGVMAWGESYATTAHAATKETASEIALRSCGERSADCQIYYADCSMAERIQ